MPDWKLQQYKEHLARKEDTIRIISKHQNWITTTPMANDRRHPLEKLKVSKMEETSRLMPKWMENKHKNCKREEEVLKSVEYSPIKQKCKKLMVFVDKDINPPKNKILNYSSQINFTAGQDWTGLTAPSSIMWHGCDVDIDEEESGDIVLNNAGTFTPISGTRYILKFFYDGTNVHCDVFGTAD